MKNNLQKFIEEYFKENKPIPKIHKVQRIMFEQMKRRVIYPMGFRWDKKDNE